MDQALIVLPDDSRPALGDDVIVRGPDGTIMHGRQAAAGVARPTSAAGQQDAARAEARAERPGPPLTARVQVEIDLGQDFRLRGMGIETGIDLDKLVDAGAYISDFLGRKPNSRTAVALLNKRA